MQRHHTKGCTVWHGGQGAVSSVGLQSTSATQRFRSVGLCENSWGARSGPAFLFSGLGVCHFCGCAVGGTHFLFAIPQGRMYYRVSVFSGELSTQGSH